MFPLDTSVTEGEGVYFKIKVSGEPQSTVTWYHDGEPVRADYAHEIEADGSLAIPSTEPKHSGIYKAVAANQHGSEEREIKLMVNEEGGASTAVAVGDMVSSRPIPIPEFGKYVAELHVNSNQPFKDLYQVYASYHNNKLFEDHKHSSNCYIFTCILYFRLCTTSALPVQALDTRERGHSIEYATKHEIKLLNRFANIVVCK